MKKKNKEKIEIIDDTEDFKTELEEENIEFTNFLNEFQGSEYKIDIRKLSKDGSSWDRVKTMSLDQFSADLIAETYGGGKYKFRIIDSSGRFVKQFTCTYAEPIKKEQEKDNKDLTMQILLGQLNNTNQMIIEMIKNYRPPQQENLKITDIINIINSLKNINDSKSEILELLKVGMDLGKQTSENESELSKFLEVLGQIYTNRMYTNRINTSMIKKPIDTNIEKSMNTEPMKNSEVITPQTEQETKIFLVCGLYKDILQKSYVSKIPADVIALYIYNNLDDVGINELFEYTSNPVNVERLSKYLNIGKEYIINTLNKLKELVNIDDSNTQEIHKS